MCITISRRKSVPLRFESQVERILYEFGQLNIKLPCGPFDRTYHSTTHETWGVVFRDVLFNLPGGMAERFDCDNYAWLVVARVAERWGLNAIALVIGDSPLGRHSWNIFRSEHGWYNLEPQTGDVFGIGEEGYTIDFAIL